MKKTILLLISIFILSSCSNNIDKFKSLSFNNEALGESENELELTSNANIVKEFNADYPSKMDLFKIIPRTVTRELFEAYKIYFNISGKIVEENGSYYVSFDNGLNSKYGMTQFYTENGNRLVYMLRNEERKITKSEDEMIKEVENMINSFPDLKEKYFYSYTNKQTLNAFYPNGKSEENIVVQMMFAFEKKINGYLIDGDDQLHIYYNSDGFCGLSITFFDYEMTQQIEILSLKDAIKNISDPATIGFDDDDKVDFKGKAKKLVVNQSRLSYINQFKNGVEILQPLYAFHGPIYSDESESEFTAKVKAVPEKYTYDN